MNATCIEGARMLPTGTVSALDLAHHWGREWHAWWAFARFGFGSFAEGEDGGNATCELSGECTADVAIGESIALDRNDEQHATASAGG